MKIWRIAVGLGLTLAVGCGRDADTLICVQGRVFYRGQPVTSGTIVFTPDPDRGGHGPQAWGVIDSEGRYRLSPGASQGWHRITIAPGASAGLPGRYRDPELSGQSFEVRSDRSNQCDLRLE